MLDKQLLYAQLICGYVVVQTGSQSHSLTQQGCEAFDTAPQNILLSKLETDGCDWLTV